MTKPDPFLRVPESQTNRQAIEALGGYAYQAYATALAWLSLRPDELLQLEVAEDFAQVASGAISMTQVKRTTRPLTLRSKAARRLLDSHWAFAKANPDRTVHAVFLTTARAAREQRSPLPAKEAGVNRWNAEAVASLSVPLLALLRDLDVSAELKAWLATATAEEIHSRLIRRITWRLGEPDSEALKQAFDTAVVARGAHLQQLPDEARRGGSALLLRVIEQSCAAGTRDLHARDVDALMVAANIVHVAPEVLRRVQASPAPYSPPCPTEPGTIRRVACTSSAQPIGSPSWDEASSARGCWNGRSATPVSAGRS